MTVYAKSFELTNGAKIFLNAFWLRHKKHRHECIEKYSFDPILEPKKYWAHGIAEPEHANILSEIKKGSKFTLRLARLWSKEELK